MTQASVALAASVAEEGRKEAREEVIEDDQDDAAAPAEPAMISGREDGLDSSGCVCRGVCSVCVWVGGWVRRCRLHGMMERFFSLWRVVAKVVASLGLRITT